jgi:hypothetical protein
VRALLQVVELVALLLVELVALLLVELVALLVVKRAVQLAAAPRLAPVMRPAERQAHPPVEP